MPQVQVVFAANESYFPLAKGLVLSIKNASLPEGFELGFIDLGCAAEQVHWLKDQGVRVTSFAGRVAELCGGWVEEVVRAQVLRPYLPVIFPDASAFIWLDSDLWIQSAETLHLFGSMAASHADKLFICPEWHYSYVDFNKHFYDQQIENFGDYHRTLYDEQTAVQLRGRPVLNSGVFSMAGKNPMWELWRHELRRLYSRDYGPKNERMRHLAEQTALNVLAARLDSAIPVDPVYNYMCMFGLPFRDRDGIVRAPMPPNPKIAVVHLSMWRQRRQLYLDRNLLFDSGRYLSVQERSALLI